MFIDPNADQFALRQEGHVIDPTPTTFWSLRSLNIALLTEGRNILSPRSINIALLTEGRNMSTPLSINIALLTEGRNISSPRSMNIAS